MKRLAVILVFIITQSIGAFSQESMKYASDHLILKFDEGKQVPDQISFEKNQLAYELVREKKLYAKGNLHLYKVISSHTADLEQLSTQINGLSIEWVSPDYYVKHRATPNDEFFSEQWDMEIIDAVSAWDITTGGTTINGDTIVVAIIDSGFYLDHEDLKDNVWRNHADPPGDNIDNDNNGFVDDHLGWNFLENSNEHSFSSHGTSVTGIIGAKGDNSKGVTGVNWNIKYLLVTGVNLVSDVLESYEYVLKQRSDYNNSNGSKGAYIVASNFSAGVPEVFPNSGPAFEMWCQLYDDLGAQGVVSVSAAPNRDEDVDQVGDMPSTCNSPYLIVVTNTGSSDTKVSTAGFGPVHVDLGAPGTGTFTVGSEGVDDYTDFPGTSASSPHVAGAVALLFSAPCQEFINLYEVNRSDGAIAMKQAILDGVDPITSLDGLTSTGGRLNIFNSMESLRIFCSGTNGDLDIANIFPNPVNGEDLTVKYQAPDFGDYYLDIYDSIGRKVYTREFSPPFFEDEKTIIIKDTSRFGQGLYFLKIEGESGKVSASFLVF